MFRANQFALVQETNQGLLNIRNAELNYYINLNVAIGTQAALIGGFTYGVFTQNQNNETYRVTHVFQQIYWVLSAATIAVALHVIITTMLLQVLGPGLALHGPVGSMTTAAEGMRKEQRPTMFAFFLMLVLFSISTVMSFWTVFSEITAATATMVFVVAARYWWQYSEKIYLRFYWDYNQEVAWDEHKERSSSTSPERFPGDIESNPIHNLYGTDLGLAKEGSAHAVPGSAEQSLEKRTFLQNIFYSSSDASKAALHTSSRREDAFPGQGREVEMEASSMAGKPPTPARGVAMEGYLTRKGKAVSSATEKKGAAAAGQRQYVVLTHAGKMFFYKSRQDYRNNPNAPLVVRPLELLDYWVDILNTDVEKAVQTEAAARVSGGVAAAPAQPIFQLILQLRDSDATNAREPVVLRCDTEEELNVWVATIAQVVPSSLRGKANA